MSDDTAEGEKYDNKSSVLALRIIEALAASPDEVALTTLARQLGTNKWKVSRHLHALRKEGFVIQNPETERFYPGLRLFAVGMSLSARKPLIAQSKAALLALQARVHLPVSLVGLVQDKAIVLDGAWENDPLAVVIGISLELHNSAHGKVALAFGPEYLLEKTLLQPLVRHGEKTITDPDRLRQEIAEVRRRGWASSLGERRREMQSVAAPILAANGIYVGSLGILYFGAAKPTSEQIQELLKATQSITDRISGTSSAASPEAGAAPAKGAGRASKASQPAG